MRLLLILLFVGGCGSKTAVSTDLSVVGGDLSVNSTCGHFGDTGNSKGIGKFCIGLTDCNDPNLVCGHPFHPDTYFCTKDCTVLPVDTAACGEDTFCQCDALGCGCTPAACGIQRG